MNENYGGMISSFFLIALLALTGYLMIVGQSVLLPFVIAIVVWRVIIVFPVLTALLTSTNWTWIIAVTVIVAALQTIFAYWVEPKMMSGRLSVSALVVMLSLAVFGAIWGIVGMFLSIPLVVIMMIIFGHFEKTRPIAVFLSENGEVPG